MNIGLLGGTFNPPHYGHLLIAQQVLDFTDCDEVWFVPGYKHTFQKPSAPVSDRLHMTQLLLEEKIRYNKTEEPNSPSKIKLCTLEIDNQLDGNTIHLLPYLPQGNTYMFIIGSDQLPSFHLWGDWKNLLNRMQFYVFPRLGYPNEPLYEGMSMVNDPVLVVSNISSTKIRDRIKRNIPLNYLVPTSIENYIYAHNLYEH